MKTRTQCCWYRSKDPHVCGALCSPVQGEQEKSNIAGVKLGPSLRLPVTLGQPLHQLQQPHSDTSKQKKYCSEVQPGYMYPKECGIDSGRAKCSSFKQLKGLGLKMLDQILIMSGEIHLHAQGAKYLAQDFQRDCCCKCTSLPFPHRSGSIWSVHAQRLLSCLPSTQAVAPS